MSQAGSASKTRPQPTSCASPQRRRRSLFTTPGVGWTRSVLRWLTSTARRAPRPLGAGTLGYFRPHTSYTYYDDPSVDAGLVAGRPGERLLASWFSKSAVQRPSTAAPTSTPVSLNTAMVPLRVVTPVAGSRARPREPLLRSSTPALGPPKSLASTRPAPSTTRLADGAADSSGAGSDARSTVTTYYTATGDGDCGGKPAWTGQICKQGPAAQPGGASVPSTYYASYTDEHQVDSIAQLSGGSVVHSTTATYDQVSRVQATVEIPSGPGVDGDTVTTNYEYDAITGLPSGSAVRTETIVASHGDQTQVEKVKRITARKATVDLVRAGAKGQFMVEPTKNGWVAVAGTGCGKPRRGERQHHHRGRQGRDHPGRRRQAARADRDGRSHRARCR